MCPLVFITCFVCVHMCSGQGWAFGGTREYRWVCMCAFMWLPYFLCVVLWELDPLLFEKGLFLEPGAYLLGWILLHPPPSTSESWAWATPLSFLQGARVPRLGEQALFLSYLRLGCLSSSGSDCFRWSSPHFSSTLPTVISFPILLQFKVESSSKVALQYRCEHKVSLLISIDWEIKPLVLHYGFPAAFARNHSHLW